MSNPRIKQRRQNMSVPVRMGKAEIGNMFLLSMVFLATILAILGVVYSDTWAKVGVGVAVIIAILLYWNITKERKSLTPLAVRVSQPDSLNQRQLDLSGLFQ